MIEIYREYDYFSARAAPRPSPTRQLGYFYKFNKVSQDPCQLDMYDTSNNDNINNSNNKER